MEYYSAIKKDRSVVGCGLGVECSLSMQEALCSILGTKGKKKAMGLTLELIDGHGNLEGPQIQYSRYTTVHMIFSSPSPGPYRMFSVTMM